MRIRVLPLLMFALAGTITIKVGTVWNALEVSVGRESLAQAQPAAETQPTPAPQPAPADQASPPPAPQPAPVDQASPPPADTAAAGNQPPATEQSAPAAAASPAEPAPQQAATTPAEPTAPGAEQPTPEEAAAAEATSEQSVPDPFDYTDEEVDVLQQLAKRREELDLRARQLDEREVLLQAAEQRMDQKLAELKALQVTMEGLTKKHSDAQEAELKSLVKTYENMKPKAAAKVFEEMDMDVLLDVAERMNERKLAPILALVTPTRAKEITFELAQRQQLPIPQ